MPKYNVEAEKIFVHIESKPGITIRELARATGRTHGVIFYYVFGVQKTNKLYGGYLKNSIVFEKQGRNTRLFSARDYELVNGKIRSRKQLSSATLAI